MDLSGLQVSVVLVWALLCTSLPPCHADNVDGADEGCPAKWNAYSSPDGHKAMCFYFSPNDEELSYRDSTTVCEAFGAKLAHLVPGSRNMEFVEETAEGQNDNFWLGLSTLNGTDQRFAWIDGSEVIRDPEGEPMIAKNSFLFDSYGYQYRRNEACVATYVGTDTFTTYDCNSRFRFVCQKPQSCSGEKFGSNCEREAHCIGRTNRNDDPYVVDDVKCGTGCQREWFGKSCDQRRQKPRVNYFCFKDPLPSLQIAVTTNGFEIINLYQYTEDGESLDTCTPIGNWSARATPGVSTLSVLMTNTTAEENSVFTHTCPSGDISSKWLVHVRENPTITLEYDVQNEMECDFSAADRRTVYKDAGIQRIIQRSSLESDTVQNDVTLTLIDYTTNLAIDVDVRMGTPVILRLDFGKMNGSSIKAILPTDCAVGPTGDDKEISNEAKTILFVDSKGCPMKGVPISGFTASGERSLVTEGFPLFSLDTRGSPVRFRCSYKVCNDPELCNPPNCDDQSESERKRRSLRRRMPRSSDVSSQQVKVIHEGHQPLTSA